MISFINQIKRVNYHFTPDLKTVQKITVILKDDVEVEIENPPQEYTTAIQDAYWVQHGKTSATDFV